MKIWLRAGAVIATEVFQHPRNCRGETDLCQGTLIAALSWACQM